MGDGTYGCRFLIEWDNGKIKDRNVFGVDSVQALLLCISCARVDLIYPQSGERDESLRFDGNDDLGLELLKDSWSEP